MRFAKLTVGLILLNTTLLGVVIWQACLLRENRQGPGLADMQNAETSASRSSSSHLQDESSAGVNSQLGMPDQTSPSCLESPSPRPASPPAAAGLNFDWKNVESEDYQTYIKNLRTIGCPEQTVRDIVKADVMQAFATQRSAVMAERLRDFQYWKADGSETSARQTLARQQRDIDATMEATLHELLGPDTLPPSTASEWRRAALEQQLSFLPADARDQAMALLLQNTGVDAQLRELSMNRPTPEIREDRLRVIEDYNRKREALHSLLTPEQYDLVDMTTSWTADNLRQAMSKFQPTEEEFRMIFGEWRKQDENLAAIFARGEPDPGNAHVFNNIAERLSPERYELYRETWWK